METPKIERLPITHKEFLVWQVEQYNKTSRPAKGYVCTVCKNRRYFATINGSGDFALRPCTCQNIIEQRIEERAEQGRRR